MVKLANSNYKKIRLEFLSLRNDGWEDFQYWIETDSTAKLGKNHINEIKKTLISGNW